MPAFEQLPLLETERVYRNDRESWELHEAYYSDPRFAWPLVAYLRSVMSDCVRNTLPFVEPCVGGGDIVRGVHLYGGPRYYLSGDIRPVLTATWIADWTAETALGIGIDAAVANASLCLTNPPFSLAMDIVEASWRRCPNAVVAILQRSTWYEPTREHPRGEWLRKHNPDQVVIGRCKFTLPDGTSCGPGDSCSYTWYVWGPGRQGLLGGHSEIIPWWEAPDATLR